MKSSIFFILLAISNFSLSIENGWIETEGVITEIKEHTGKNARESALVKFILEDGSEQYGHLDLLNIPFLGNIESVGDTITINYNKNNPVLLETVFGRMLSNYGIYILICLGILFWMKPFLKRWKAIELEP